MKLAAIASRGALRDIWDLHAILLYRGTALDAALDMFRRKYANEDVGHVIRSLVYFEDADREPRPDGLTNAQWHRVQSDLRRWVRQL